MGVRELVDLIRKFSQHKGTGAKQPIEHWKQIARQEHKHHFELAPHNNISGILSVRVHREKAVKPKRPKWQIGNRTRYLKERTAQSRICFLRRLDLLDLLISGRRTNGCLHIFIYGRTFSTCIDYLFVKISHFRANVIPGKVEKLKQKQECENYIKYVPVKSASSVRRPDTTAQQPVSIPKFGLKIGAKVASIPFSRLSDHRYYIGRNLYRSLVRVTE
jgi:hypothetical protein